MDEHNSQKKINTPEEMALVFMDSIRPSASSWTAVYFHFSKLQTYHQTPMMLENTGTVLQRTLVGHSFKIFTLSNQDIVTFIQNISVMKIEGSIVEMRKIFANDPLAQTGMGQEYFYKTFPLHHAFEEVYELTASTRSHGKQGVHYLGNQPPLTSAPMLPMESMLKLQQILKNADMSNFVRRQNVYEMNTSLTGKKVGAEYYTSLEHIEDVIEADSHIIHDFALFKYLSVMLDRKMLTHLSTQLSHVDKSQRIHINLNMRSIISKDFFEFHKKIHPRGVIIELDRTDVLWDQEGFYFTNDFLKSYNHQVCLDLITGYNLQLFMNTNIVCDFYKILADEDLFQHHGDELKEFIEYVGSDKIIFARCESPIPVEKGLSYGVDLYQGRYLDQLFK